MENQKDIFKVEELLDIVEELRKVCMNHNLITATKNYVGFTAEYDYINNTAKLKGFLNYTVEGSTDNELTGRLIEEYEFLVESFGDSIDFSDILNYKVEGE